MFSRVYFGSESLMCHAETQWVQVSIFLISTTVISYLMLQKWAEISWLTADLLIIERELNPMALRPGCHPLQMMAPVQDGSARIRICWLNVFSTRGHVDASFFFVHVSGLFYRFWYVGLNTEPLKRSRGYIDLQRQWKNARNGSKRWTCDKHICWAAPTCGTHAPVVPAVPVFLRILVAHKFCLFSKSSCCPPSIMANVNQKTVVSQSKGKM